MNSTELWTCLVGLPEVFDPGRQQRTGDRLSLIGHEEGAVHGDVEGLSTNRRGHTQIHHRSLFFR